MLVLGIETSCDETAASIVERIGDTANPIPHGNILSNVVHSQIEEHAPFGGVVPEIASRAHLSKLDFIIEKALLDAGKDLTDMDAIAVTAGPGLMGGLMTGLMTAKALSAATGIPFYAINHLEGHALTGRLTNQVQFPYLLLLVSGGHSQFLEVNGLGDYTRLATTIDDALGEAFDKTAKLLSLGHPGGPLVEQAAKSGDPKRFQFPRPLPKKTDMNFSFSGLKTAVRKAAQDNAPLSNQDVADICASFQQAIVDVLKNRTRKMIAKFENTHPNLEDKNLVVAGGVAANKRIAEVLTKTCEEFGWSLIAPPANLCTDNAAMIAWAGLEHLGNSEPSPQNVAPRSRWPLDETSKSIIGSGRRGAKA
ncbi:MAG: tRNA (adenosine(37)-N6)-threonylcarbamoyltransferase complex transferase subunit TsaD [Hyphomicrobiales bacterium]|nr:tRNA (adenosine(37)-N6)-threonylcarbamoyltransferase complex transferase subunit TsaD [Hyphomicrobiales bacterium]PCH50373.1 MAG: tRNA (adenosine(37)-N6)-threonylcarbamoyltransferase complex transferase subunit TsaD [Hyphomicrobiales bacterium]